MRRRSLLPVACLLAALAAIPSARPQDGPPADGVPTFHWPHRTVGVVVWEDQIAKLTNRPSALQLYHALNRGQWQKGARLALNELKSLDAGKKGFVFTADKDGEYEFCVQFVYPDGSVSPQANEFAPQQRIVVDTVPPAVRVFPVGNGVEWTATDDNLDPREVILECKWPTSANWTPIKDRAFKTADRYAWQLPPGKVLEVQVKVKDRAGNEGVSPVVRLPADAAMGTAFPRPSGGGAGPTWPPTGGGAGGARDPITAGGLPQPRIEYVRNKEFNVEYTIQRMGRSGIQAAHLFVQKPQGNWQLEKRFPTKLGPADGNQTLALPYTADAEGVYGFIVIPESGAGLRAPDPKKDDPPMILVVADWTSPYVKITGVQVRPGGVRGPLVEISWEVADPNLMTDGISLEYSLDKNAVQWKEIRLRLGNDPGRTTGRFVWEVPDEQLWKFWVRARAVDKAANTGEHVWDTEVIVDLEKPAAGITGVKGKDGPGGSPAPAPGGTPAPRPADPSPSRPPGGPPTPMLPDTP